LLSAGGQCCLVFTPKFNDWQGWRSIQLEVVDFQPGTQARLDGNPGEQRWDPVSAL